MANAKSLAGLMKWLHREEWHNAFDELQERHLGRACSKAGIAIEEPADVLGEQCYSMLWGCVFEDLLARELSTITSGDGAGRKAHPHGPICWRYAPRF